MFVPLNAPKRSNLKVHLPKPMRTFFTLVMVLLTINAISQSPCQQGTILINGSPIDAIAFENDNHSGLSLPLWLKEGTTLAAGNRVLFISVLEFEVISQSEGSNLVFKQVLHINSQGTTVPAGKAWKVESIIKHANVLASGFSASSNSPVCQNQPLNLSATSVDGATYQWTGPNGFSSTSQNPVIASASLDAGGTYSVTAVLNGCTSSPSSASVVVNPLPTSTYTTSPAMLTTNVNTTFIPTVTGASYSWTFASGTPASSSAQNPIVQWSSAGNYDVTLTVTDANGCSSTTVQAVSVSNCIPGQPSSVFTWSPSTVLAGNAATFSPNLTGNAYSWTFDGGSPGSSSSSNPAVTWASAGTYDVTLTASSNGCSSTTTIPVTVNACAGPSNWITNSTSFTQNNSTYASSILGGYPATSSVDGAVGNGTGRWVSGQNLGMPQWVIYNIGSSYTVDQFRIWNLHDDHANQGIKDFKLQTASSISGPWTDVLTAQAAAQSSSWQTFTLPSPATSQYWRLYVTSGWDTTNGWVQVLEVGWKGCH